MVRRAGTLLLAAVATAFVARPRAGLPPPRAPGAACVRARRVALLASEAAGKAEEAPRVGLRGWVKKATSFDKADLAKLGVSAFFSYGFVSNVNSVLLLSFTWATYRAANPLISPLSASAVLANPLTWFPLKKAFLAYYVGYYATIGSILRPFRFGVAIALAPTFDRAYTSVQEKLKVPRAVATFLVTMVANVAFSVALLLAAINVFCAALRVTPVPL